MSLSTSCDPSTLLRATGPLTARDTLADQLVRAELTRGLLGAMVEPVTVGRYEVLDALGRGGMGAVYRAYDPDLRRQVALKVVRPYPSVNAESSRSLVREAAALARLSHPNIVSLYELGHHGEDVYLAMELVRGFDLAIWAHRHTDPDSGLRDAKLGVAVGILRQAACGLAAAHRAGVVHGDFKPSNVLVGTDGEVRIADFGLALTCPTKAGAIASKPAWDTDATTAAGTPRYMAPEQRAGLGATPHSEQFSFCVAAWEVLQGVHPWRGGLPAATPPAVQVRGRIDGVMACLLRGLAIDPSQRHASMEGLLRELEERELDLRHAGLGTPVRNPNTHSPRG